MSLTLSIRVVKILLFLNLSVGFRRKLDLVGTLGKTKIRGEYFEELKNNRKTIIIKLHQIFIFYLFSLNINIIIFKT